MEDPTVVYLVVCGGIDSSIQASRSRANRGLKYLNMEALNGLVYWRKKKEKKRQKWAKVIIEETLMPHQTINSFKYIYQPDSTFQRFMISSAKSLG